MKQNMINSEKVTVLSPDASDTPLEISQKPARIKLFLISSVEGHLPGEIVLFPYDQAMDLINKNIARRA